MAAWMALLMGVRWVALMVADSVALKDRLLVDLTVVMWGMMMAARSAASKEYTRAGTMAERSANLTAGKTALYLAE
jgi:hypothetical protein